MGLSLSEIVIILIVIVLVTKPTDVPIIIKNIKFLFTYLTALKHDFFNFIDTKVLDEEDKKHQVDNLDNINFYINKIIEIEGKYDGEYNLAAVKAYYHKTLILNKVNLLTKD